MSRMKMEQVDQQSDLMVKCHPAAPKPNGKKRKDPGDQLSTIL